MAVYMFPIESVLWAGSSQRWACVNSDDHYLALFRSKPELIPQKMRYNRFWNLAADTISLVDVTEIADAPGDRPTFTIVKAPGSKPLKFSTTTPEQRDEWVGYLTLYTEALRETGTIPDDLLECPGQAGVAAGATAGPVARALPVAIVYRPHVAPPSVPGAPPYGPPRFVSTPTCVYGGPPPAAPPVAVAGPAGPPMAAVAMGGAAVGGGAVLVGYHAGASAPPSEAPPPSYVESVAPAPAPGYGAAPAAPVYAPATGPSPTGAPPAYDGPRADAETLAIAAPPAAIVLPAASLAIYSAPANRAAYTPARYTAQA